MGKLSFNLLLLFFVVLNVAHSQAKNNDAKNNDEQEKRLGRLEDKMDSMYSMVNWLYKKQLEPELKDLNELIEREGKYSYHSRDELQWRVKAKISLVGSEWIKQKDITAQYGPKYLAKLSTYYDGESLAELIRLLISKGFPLNNSIDNSDNILTHLIKNNGGDLLEAIRILISNGINVNFKNDRDENALLLLAKKYRHNNLAEILRLLISAGVDINYKDEREENVLLLLARNYGHNNLAEILRLLISAGVDINSTTIHGEDVLFLLDAHLSKQDNLTEIIQVLISAGLDMKRSVFDGVPVVDIYLSYFCQKYQNKNLLDVVKLLVSNGAQVNYTHERSGNLLEALCRGNGRNENLLDIVKYLFSVGFDAKLLEPDTLQCYEGNFVEHSGYGDEKENKEDENDVRSREVIKFLKSKLSN